MLVAVKTPSVDQVWEERLYWLKPEVEGVHLEQTAPVVCEAQADPGPAILAISLYRICFSTSTYLLRN